MGLELFGATRLAPVGSNPGFATSVICTSILRSSRQGHPVPGAVSKAVVRLSAPWVQIPPSPFGVLGLQGNPGDFRFLCTLSCTRLTRLPLRPRDDAAVVAKLHPCLGQGIHNSRDHNIPYMYELTGAPMSALSRLPSRMGVECGRRAGGAYTPQTSKLPLSSTSRFE